MSTFVEYVRRTLRDEILKLAGDTAKTLNGKAPTIHTHTGYLASGTKLAAASASNTASDTTLATGPTIAAANLSTNTVIRLDLDGNFDAIATSGTFSIKIKVNGTTVNTITAGGSQTGAGTALTWQILTRLSVDATGVSGSVALTGVRQNRNAAAALANALDQVTGVTVDLSSGLTVTVVASMGTANAGNVLRLIRGLHIQEAA